MEGFLKVGELASRTGLTVRTLHHYDEIGLLTPSSRTAAGHRLYAEDDVRLLQQITSLKSLGLPLDRIASWLDRPSSSVTEALELQEERVAEEIRELRKLQKRIRRLLRQVERDGELSVTELTELIRRTVLHSRYFDPSQLTRLEERAETIGPAAIERAQLEWEELFDGFRQAMDDGLAPDHPSVRRLARRSRDLVDAFTGGDPAIERSLTEMYRSEGPGKVLEPHGMGMTDELWRYMAEAREALG